MTDNFPPSPQGEPLLITPMMGFIPNREEMIRLQALTLAVNTTDVLTVSEKIKAAQTYFDYLDKGVSPKRKAKA